MRRIIVTTRAASSASVVLVHRRLPVDTAEVRASGCSKINFRLFDRCVVTPFQIVRQAQSKAIDHIEIGVDTLRLLQSLDRRICLSQPQQDMVPRPARPWASFGLIVMARSISACAWLYL